MTTFIVRLWQPGDTDPVDIPPAHLAGEVTHVTSGSTVRFGTTEQLLTFMETATFVQESQ